MAQGIIFGGVKGGTGKSTISTNIAIMAHRMGHDVLFIDTDKQMTATKFFERRFELQGKSDFECVHKTGSNLKVGITNLAKKFEIVIIDAGGYDSVELRSSLICPAVTKFFAPLQPSEPDLNTLPSLDEMVSSSKVYNEKLEANIILNMCSTHAKVSTANEATELIIDEFKKNFLLCPAKIGSRIAYQYASREAVAVVEWEANHIAFMPPYQAKSYQPKASNEMKALYKEVFGEKYDA